jgi:hypothetical protein
MAEDHGVICVEYTCDRNENQSHCEIPNASVILILKWHRSALVPFEKNRLSADYVTVVSVYLKEPIRTEVRFNDPTLKTLQSGSDTIIFPSWGKWCPIP